jgi:hypothetical protein
MSLLAATNLPGDSGEEVVMRSPEIRARHKQGNEITITLVTAEKIVSPLPIIPHSFY